MSTALLVQIDGVTVPLDDCFWVRIDSAGCAFSSITGDMAATEEQAHKAFKPRQRDRDRDIRQGFTVRLLSHDQWRDQAAPCFYGKCAHHPKPAGAGGPR